jgi:Clostripain family
MDRKWTVIVYMVADTGEGFYQDAMDNVTQMTKAEFDKSVQVVVHADAPSPWTSKCWKVKRGSASPLGCRHTCLLEFVDDCVRHYRAENYLIVLWGHGEGIDWKQKVLADSRLGAKIDGAGKRLWPGSESVLEVAELGKILKVVHEKLKELNINNVVIGFDACLMAMVEVYFEIHPYVSWAVAANDEIPDSGWPYKEILTKLKNPNIGPAELAKSIIEKCTNWYSDPNNKFAVSFSACNLKEDFSDRLAERVRELREAIEEHLNLDPRKATMDIRNARDFAADLDESAYVDLNAFCSKLGNESALGKLREAASKVVAALTNFASKSDFSDYYPQKYTKDSRAVAICFPQSRNLQGSIPHQEIDLTSYVNLEFIKETKWSSFWNTYWDNLAKIETENARAVDPNESPKTQRRNKSVLWCKPEVEQFTRTQSETRRSQ